MKIEVPFKKLRKIEHTADIHIRLFKRHDEYREAFNTFYEQLRQKDLTDGVIVVAGDILHAKTDMSPEHQSSSVILRTSHRPSSSLAITTSICPI
jgi:hypothetical protein